VYVRLSSYLGGTWQYTDYTFSAATAPALAFTGESGYTGDGVEPNTGAPGGSFAFRVKYTNADGFAPLAGSPQVHILSAGSPIPGSPFTLSRVSGLLTGGAIYAYSQTLAAGTYSCHFEAVDSRGLAAAGPPTVDLSGPVVAMFGLTVTLAGSASGTVTSNVGGISCPGTCTTNLGGGTPVILTESPGAGASFKEWRGPCTGSTPTCNLIMDAAKTATAVFSKLFTDDPLVAQSTLIKAVHFTELREAINTLRAHYNLAAFAWSGVAPAPGGTVSAAHLPDLRTALTDAYVAASRPAPTYTDSTITVGQTTIKASHLSELRSLVRALE
jgi:hypothetical protein